MSAPPRRSQPAPQAAPIPQAAELSVAERRELDRLRGEAAIIVMREAVEAARLEATAEAERVAELRRARERKRWMRILAVVAIIALWLGNASAGHTPRERQAATPAASYAQAAPQGMSQADAEAEYNHAHWPR